MVAAGVPAGVGGRPGQPPLILLTETRYVEGIDVLYATNTIHSASKELLYNVDRFLLPQRLVRIASVQLMWEFDEPRLHDRAQRVPTFKQFLDAVPAIFPHVQQLYLTVQWRTPLPSRADVPRTTTREEFETAEDIVMRPVDRMVRRLGGHVRECSVAIPSTMYDPRQRQAKRAGQRVEQMFYGDAVERFWPATGCGTATRTSPFPSTGARWRTSGCRCRCTLKTGCCSRLGSEWVPRTCSTGED